MNNPKDQRGESGRAGVDLVLSVVVAAVIAWCIFSYADTVSSVVNHWNIVSECLARPMECKGV